MGVYRALPPHIQEESKMSEQQNFGLSTIDQSELASIEAEIAVEFDKVEQTKRDSFIKVGELLCDARKLISDDTQFGEWRQNNTPIASKQDANSAMQIHRAIQEGVITPKMLSSKLGQSHLIEIVRAPLSVQNDIELLVSKEGAKVPTIKNIRDMVKVAHVPTKDSAQAEQSGTEQAGAAENTTKSPTKGASTGTDVEPSYQNGYQEKTTPIARTKSEQYGDSLGIIDQLLQDALEESAVAHGLANKDLNDNQRSQQVNDLRVALKAAINGVNEMLTFNEGRS
ncbi:hypothetical protein VPHK225_0039 [Vibrio phage K225]